MSRRVRFALRFSVVSLLVFALAFQPLDKTLALPAAGYRLAVRGVGYAKEVRHGYERQTRLQAINAARAPFRRAPLVQGGSDLDYLRANTPALPDPPSGTNIAPPAGYDDPKPAATSNFNAWYTSLSTTAYDTGVPGTKPMQSGDPTMGNATIGGLSYLFDSQNLNFTAPILSLAGRAGLHLSLAMSYNSRVWNNNSGTWFFNPDKGFPGPGWRIGFGAIQGINNAGNVGPYTNSVTGKASFLYIAPDGSRHDLAYNTTTTKYEVITHRF
jgi:hypothetical protein